MLNRRFTPYLITVGILALLTASYLGHREYQNYVVHEEFMSRAMAFQHTLDKDAPPDTDSVDWQTTQRGANAAFPTRDLAANQTGQSDNWEGSPQTPVKVQVLPPEQEAKYVVRKKPLPYVPEGTWTVDEMVTQFVELPDGKIVKIVSIPGMEIREGDAVSLQYIANNMPERITHVEMEDGKRYEVPIGANPDEFINKLGWGHHLGISAEETERMISNRELIVKPEGESLTSEEEGIMARLLNKIPKFASFLRSERPDLLDAETVRDGAHQPESGGIEPDRSDSSSYPRQSPWDEYTPGPQGKAEKQEPRPSEPSTKSSREPESRAGVSPERFDKAQQLIDQYGRDEGLRRLRESDPEAARQFERERQEPPVPSEPDDKSSTQ